LETDTPSVNYSGKILARGIIADGVAEVSKTTQEWLREEGKWPSQTVESE